LHNVLSKARNKSIFTKTSLPTSIVKQEDVTQEAGQGVDFDKIAVNEEENMEANETDQKASLTMDTMSEFCRNLGSTSNDARRNRSFNNDDDDDDEDEDVKVNGNKLKNGSKSKNKMDTDDEDDDKEENGKSDDEDEDMEKASIQDTDEEENRILEDEPTIDRGLASCLKLAVTKGYLGQEKEKKNAKITKAPIEAINFTIEEKSYYDIDDKYNRNRDRFSGPLMDFDEKSNYKPEVKIDYIDEKGHNMNEKEAFRYLSHRFHGKGSGKKKTEKRYKKLKEIESMKKMSSVDTPLNTVALLVEKQKRLQQPYVVLSTAKGKQDQLVFFFNF
jgi:U4/U6.U5 tri-snRNP-associated protein 1